MIVLFFIVYGCLRLCRFDRNGSITALFCGSKQSLMHGTAMAVVLLGGSGMNLDVVLLPIIFYHALQLVIVSLIASRYTASSESAQFS